MIESKYTIEYINPENTTKTASKSRQYLFALGGLSLAALAYFLITLPAKKTVHQAKVVVSQQQQKKQTTNKASNLSTPVPPIKEKTTTKLATTHPVTSSSNKAIAVTTDQTRLVPDIKSFDTVSEKNKTSQTPSQDESLEKLKAQLLETQNRNKELANELDAQIMENMELAALLEDSLYKINKEDKNYIKELKKLEQNTVKVVTNKNTRKKSLTIKTPIISESKSTIQTPVKNITKIKNKTKSSVIKNQAKIATPAPKNNRVDLSTASQIDAIIATINNTNKLSRQKQQGGSSGIEASKVKLQTDINDMINHSKKSQFDKFQKSLNKI